METSTEGFPDLPTLTAGLTDALGGSGAMDGSLMILERRPNVPVSTFPVEVVTCRVNGGSALRVFCKYSAGRGHEAHGHRGGVAYELEVYRRVLEPLQVSAPKLLGAHTDQATGETWLVLEYVEGLRLRDAQSSADLVRAASWCGGFHAAQARRSAPAPSFLNTYDAAYYHGWVSRTAAFAKGLLPQVPWLTALTQRAEQAIATLLEPPLTIIHGEYYPPNILVRDGVVYPLDWESAAIAAGEIDLATLPEGWPEAFALECEGAYQQARWPDGPPADFAWRLSAARMYVQFRWLGDQPSWTTHPFSLRRFKRLRAAGEQLGLI